MKSATILGCGIVDETGIAGTRGITANWSDLQMIAPGTAKTMRTVFGKKIAEHSVWEERIARARMDIEMTRLLCLKAADMMDKVGNKGAQNEIAMIKVAGPLAALRIIDDAIQAHGAAGVTTDFGLARAYASMRTMRLADGPDEVHNRAIARNEFKKYRDNEYASKVAGDNYAASGRA